MYYPLEVEPYTPAHHFEGKNDPGFGAKPHIAMELVERALEMGLPFRAVVGDILYGEHRKFKEGLEEKGIPYVLSLKPSHTWWHPMGEVGWVEGVTQSAYWNGPDDPGEWVNLTSPFAATGRWCAWPSPSAGGRAPISWRPRHRQGSHPNQRN